MIPYGCHSIDEHDIEAITNVLKNKFLTQGNEVPKFEAALSQTVDVHHVVAVNSGTSALHIACMGMGVGAGDVVWTSPNSFVASANCARFCGADVDFVDIDPVTRNMSVDALDAKLQNAVKKNRLPKVIIPVHFGGQSCDMKAIRDITHQYGIKIIEDASHALGAYYAGKAVGQCEFSDACVLSFHPVKPITSAEGGAVLTNDSELHRKLRLFASHGITRDQDSMVKPAQISWYYEQQILGYNYRLSDLHAALGTSQLTKLGHFTSRRRELAKTYFTLLESLPLKLPDTKEIDASAWHLYPVEVINNNRDDVYNALRSAGIGVNVHYYPIHLQPYYRALGFSEGQFPNAENYATNALTLPLFPTMTSEQQNIVADTLHTVL